jgi:hypothetical protein
VRDHGKRADNLREKHEDKGEELSQMTSRHVKLEAAYKEEREVRASWGRSLLSKNPDI